MGYGGQFSGRGHDLFGCTLNNGINYIKYFVVVAANNIFAIDHEGWGAGYFLVIIDDCIGLFDFQID
jgi:hypothetical protein